MPSEHDETLAQVLTTVKQICAGFPGEYWRANDAQRAYPEEFVQALSRAGLLACLIPQSYGGSGLSLGSASAILTAIHESGCNAAACHAQMYTMGTLLRHGSEVQKTRYLPDIASGKLRLQAFGVTEPGAGTDTSSITTTATRDGDHYIIRGQKVWISRAEHSDLMILLARTSPAGEHGKPSQGLSVFIVDMKQALQQGMTIKAVATMINHATTEIFFDDVPVPAENLIGEAGKGFNYILSGMNAERILIASECIGDARWFIEKASAYASERRVFGRPIGQNQGVQFPIARAYAQTEAAQLMVENAAALYDAGKHCGAEANMAKMLASEASWAAGEACMQTHGGFGLATEYDVERKWRETRLYQIAPVSTNLILAYLGEHVLGMPRSY